MNWNALVQQLASYPCTATLKSNLLSMSGGKWHVEYNGLRYIYFLIEKDREHNRPFHLVEKPHPRGRLFFDFDGKTKLNVAAIHEAIQFACDQIFVLEQPAEVYVSNSSVYPDTKMHFLVPEIYCEKDIRFVINKLIKSRLQEKQQLSDADALDLAATSLRIRHALKVDKSGKYIYAKGVYLSYKPLDEASRVPFALILSAQC